MIAISGVASVAFGIFLVYQIGLFTLALWIQKDFGCYRIDYKGQFQLITGDSAFLLTAAIGLDRHKRS